MIIPGRLSKGAPVRCYCCDREMTSAPEGAAAPSRDGWGNGGPDSPAYKAYLEEITFRWTVVCQACYSTLDNAAGLAEIAGKPYNIAGASRIDKAATIDEAKYREFRRKEAAKLGLDLDEDAE